MSMSRSGYQELCDFILHKPSTVLGAKFFDCRIVVPSDVSVKSDKYEPRLLAISKFRVFLVHGKTPSSLKIDRSFHLLSIKALQVVKEDEVAITIDEGGSRRKISVRGNPANIITSNILTAIKHYFPDIAPALRNALEVRPSNLLQSFDDIRIDVAPRPCHSFRRTYAAMCDYFDQPYREEVSWDVEKIYAVNKIRDLRIEDFSHLLPKDLLPIVAVLQYSSYFVGVSVDGLKLTSDLIDVLLSVLRKSHWLSSLTLVNCALPKDFITSLSSAIHVNPSLPLEHLNLSKNAFDDKKGFQQLSSVFPRLLSLKEVRFSDCALTDKCCSLLCGALYGALSNRNTAMQLSHLDLSNNHIAGDVASLVNLISLCNSLRVLDLSTTQFPLDKLWPALKYGGLQIEKLILSGCVVGGKKAAVESATPVKEFFAMAVSLREIDFSNTPLPSEVLKALLLGLASNQQLKPFSLVLNACIEKGGAPVVEACIAGVGAQHLSLRDNALESDMVGVVASVCRMPNLSRVDLGGTNLAGLRRSNKHAHSQQLNRTLHEIIKLVGEEGRVEELILSEARLGAHLSVLLNTIGASGHLKVLDISANEMGNFGARILSKALQLNVSLRTLHIDGNHVGVDGFADIASALQMNHTLVTLPYPVIDASEAMTRGDRSRTLAALSTIERALERNRLLSAPENANFRRAQFTLLQCSDGAAAEGVSAADYLLQGARSDTVLPLSMRGTLEKFVNQLREEMTEHICSSVNVGDEGVNVDEVVGRVGEAAGERLHHSLLANTVAVFSEWKWRSAAECAQSLLKASTTSVGETSSSRSPSQGVASPRFLSRSDGFRPRSIVGDPSMSSLAEESGVSLDAPPKPSALVHLAKGRPRPQRRLAAAKERSGSTPSDDMSRSACDVVCETDEDGASVQSSEGPDSEREPARKSLRDRPVFRAAMLPEASLLSAVQLRPAADRALTSPKLLNKDTKFPSENSSPGADSIQSLRAADEESESPPPLPRRNKPSASLDSPVSSGPPSTPPLLPPKPEPRGFPGPRMGAVLRTVPPPVDPAPADDDENANNRRSVADMARMFNR